jgi:hypothetical protein
MDMTGGGTPIESLPTYKDDIEEEMPEMRPQGRQLKGAADFAHYDDEEDYEYIEPRSYKKKESLLDYVKREGYVPAVAGIIYVLLNLDFVDEKLIKYIPRLFNAQCEITLTGTAFKGALLAVLLLLAKRFLL